MAGFTKLFQEILSSSIWNEDDKTRIVWVTLLAACNQGGVVRASVGGLAHQARVSRDDCFRALEKLSSPDEDSRSEEWDGRRIGKIDGGFLILNYARYRDRRSEDERREYMREYMRKYRKQNVNNSKQSKPGLAYAEAEAEAEKELFPETAPRPAPSKPLPDTGAFTASPRRKEHPKFPEFWDAYGYKVKRGEAVKPFTNATARADVATIIEEARWHAQNDKGIRPYPASWLNADGWLDSHEVIAKKGRGNGRVNQRVAGTANENPTGPRTLDEIKAAREANKNKPK